MTSSSSLSSSDEDIKIENPPTCSRQDVPAQLKEELRQSIIAKRRARGEKQLKIEHREPQQMELTSAEIEKKERRREQNRRAAQRCRSKKRTNQKNVIQNFEKVMARNQELQLELDSLKQELFALKNVYSDHSICCSAFSKVKSESKDVIKIEPITDEELEDTTHEDSSCKFEDFIDHDNFVQISQFLPNIKTKYYGPTHNSNSTNTMISPYKKEHGENQTQAEILQQFQSHTSSLNIKQQPVRQCYTSSHAVQNPSSTSYMFNESSRNVNPVFKSDERLDQSQKPPSHEFLEERQNHKLQLEQNKCITTDHGQDLFLQYRSLPLSHSATIPSTYVRPQSHHYPEQMLQTQNSPCQVVPSLRSPKPSSTTHRNSFSSDVCRHRSLSGGSISASETSRSCIEDKRFNSVSSEGSVYTDNQGSMYQEERTVEVPDFEADDVFIVTGSDESLPLDGHDTNNNLESMRDNNRVTDNDVIQFLASHFLYNAVELPGSSRGNRTPDYANISLMEADEVNSILQISSDDLRLFSDIDNSEQAVDALNQILSDSHRLDC